jgi:hypothetical protein
MSKSKKIRGFRIDESLDEEKWFKEISPEQIETIILYHGSSTLFLDFILKEGLKPRKETGISNWAQNDVPNLESHPDFVYLVTMEDAKVLGGKEYTEDLTHRKGHLVIIEVEVDTKNLYPDTDFIKELYTWYESLIEHGSVAYRGSISPENIRRVWERIGFPWNTKYKLIVDNVKS